MEPGGIPIVLPSILTTGISVKLSDVQRRVLKQLANGGVVGEEWLDLGDSGISRATVRALLSIGAIEQKAEGFPGQLAGQAYRVTPAGRNATLARQPLDHMADRVRAKPIGKSSVSFNSWHHHDLSEPQTP